MKLSFLINAQIHHRWFHFQFYHLFTASLKSFSISLRSQFLQWHCWIFIDSFRNVFKFGIIFFPNTSFVSHLCLVPSLIQPLLLLLLSLPNVPLQFKNVDIYIFVCMSHLFHFNLNIFFLLHFFPSTSSSSSYFLLFQF